MRAQRLTDASDAENALAAFDNSVVMNGTADSTAPTLTSATVVGTAVKLNFSEVLQTTHTLTNSLFTVEIQPMVDQPGVRKAQREWK